jgi:hypothetical protein
MKLAVVTNFTPSKSNVSEYGYHLAKNFAKNQDVSELIVFTENSIDQTNTNDYSKINGCTVKINECLDRKTTKNAFSILKAVKEEKPDAILFNIHSTQPNSNSLMSVLLPLVSSTTSDCALAKRQAAVQLTLPNSVLTNIEPFNGLILVSGWSESLFSPST